MNRTPLTSLESLLRLGWSFARTVIRNRFVRGSQLPRVLAQYRPDGMLSAKPTDPAVLAGAARCIACARCDVRALEVHAYTALGTQGPMAFVLGASRLAGSAGMLPEATPELLADLTLACPTAVPFAPLVALVRRRETEFAAARMDPPRQARALTSG